MAFVRTDCDHYAASVLLGNGHGSFQPAASYGAENIWPVSVAVADFNSDGRIDVVTANEFGPNVTALLGNGLQAPSNYTAECYSWPLAVGDFNGDGRPDVVTGNDEDVSILLNKFGFHPAGQSAKRIEAFGRKCVLALRGNIARHIKGMDHRDFCIRLADSSRLQWFIQIGRVDKVKTYAKSSSDRFARWIDEAGLRSINNRLIGLLAGTEADSIPLDIGLAESISLNDVYFDSTSLKLPSTSLSTGYCCATPPARG